MKVLLPTPDPVELVRTPRPFLTRDQARLQASIFGYLRDRGHPVQDPGDVYPWLLSEVAKVAAEAPPASAGPEVLLPR